MPETPITKIRIPIYLRDEIDKRVKNRSQWIIQAIQEKLNRERNATKKY